MYFFAYRSSVIAQRVLKNFCSFLTGYHSAMDLKDIVTKLNEFAPLQLAAKWDNVGLLVEPTLPHFVSSILLTNDLTERVAQEAIDKQVNMVISYHPPIFAPLKCLTSKAFKERIIVKMIENRIAVYSPHTAFDAVKNGVNDWLASGLGSAQVDPLEYSKEESPIRYKLLTSVSTNQKSDLITTLEDGLRGIDGVESIAVETLARLVIHF